MEKCDYLEIMLIEQNKKLDELIKNRFNHYIELCKGKKDNTNDNISYTETESESEKIKS